MFRDLEIRDPTKFNQYLEEPQLRYLGWNGLNQRSSAIFIGILRKTKIEEEIYLYRIERRSFTRKYKEN